MKYENKRLTVSRANHFRNFFVLKRQLPGKRQAFPDSQEGSNLANFSAGELVSPNVQISW
jgi:hypothetical protein